MSSFFRISPAMVYEVAAGGELTSLGPTQGGVSMELILEPIDTIHDEDGTTPLSHVLGGTGGRLMIPMTQLSLDRLSLVVPAAELQVVPDTRLWVGSAVAVDLAAYQKRILLKSVVDGVETIDPVTVGFPAVANWLTLLKAAPVAFSALEYTKNKQQIIEVTFQLYPDPDVLTPLGRKAVVVFGTPP